MRSGGAGARGDWRRQKKYTNSRTLTRTIGRGTESGRMRKWSFYATVHLNCEIVTNRGRLSQFHRMKPLYRFTKIAGIFS